VRVADRELAIAKALMLAEFVEKERQAALLDAGHPTVASVVDRWIDDRLPHMGWKAGTRRNNLAKMNRIRDELGRRIFHRTDSLFLTEWLEGFCKTSDQYNKWRYSLWLLWDFAVPRKLAPINEAALIQERSVSLNNPVNRKVRHALDIEGFIAIREYAPEWLKLAMDIALVTLQGRNEVVNMKHSDFRGGFLYVIRKKTEGTSDTAFIRMPITVDLQDFKSRGLRLDNTAAPNLVHRRPGRRRRDWAAPEGEHWTYIRPDYLTKAFADAREASGHFTHLKEDEKPTFHEIRGLGARRCQERGMEQAAIKMLMTHADQKTTDIYLNGGAEALRDEHFVIVEAPLTLAQMTG
jgi:hypothetical protein